MSVSVDEEKWLTALANNNLVELERLSLFAPPLVITHYLVYRLIRSCWTTSLLCGLVETLPRQWMLGPVYNGWTVLHQLSALKSIDFDCASHIIRCVPREALAISIRDNVGMFKFTACERALWYGSYDLANALLAHGALVNYERLKETHTMTHTTSTSMYDQIREAQNKARQAAAVVYGILRLRRWGIPRDMATNCAQEVYATRGFEEWTY